MANELYDLAARISVDASQSDKVLTKTQQQVLALAKEFEKTEAAAKKSTAGMGQGVLTLEKQLASAESLQKQRSASLLSNWKKEEQAVAQRFKAEEQAAKQAAAAVGKDLQGALQGVAPSLASLAGAAGPVTAVAVAVAAVAAASIAAAYGFYQLSISAAEIGQEIYKAQVRTNLSVSTLGAFKVAAEESGGALSGVTAGLGMFEAKMESANEGNKKLSALFKALRIDVKDNEKGFRDIISVLVELNGAQQIGVAKTFFGKSYRDILASIKEIQATGSTNLDDYIAKLQKMGLVLGDDDVKASHALTKQLVDLSNQWDVMKVKIGSEWMPTVSKALTDFSSWLRDNQKELREAATLIGTVASAIYGLASAIHTISPYRIAGQIVDQYNAAHDTSGVAGPAPVALRGGGSAWPGPVKLTGGGSAWPSSRAGEIDAALKALNEKATKTKMGTDPAIAAKQLADLQLQYVLIGLKAEDDANKRSLQLRRVDFETYAAQYKATENERHTAVLSGLMAEEVAARNLRKDDTNALQTITNKRKQEEITHTQNLNKVTDEGLVINERVSDFMKQQLERIADLDKNTSQYEIQIRSLTDALSKQGVTLSALQLAEMHHLATLEEIAKVMKQMRENPIDIFDLPAPGGNVYKGRAKEDAAQRAEQEAFNRKIQETIGSAPAMRPAFLLKDKTITEYYDRLRVMADNTASVLSNAIRTGFEQGAAAGFKSLLSGFLDMLAKMAEQMLASAMFKMLTKFLSPKDDNSDEGDSGGSSGGGLAGLFSSLLKGLFSGGHAAGGFIGPGQFGLVGERGPEFVSGGRSGKTITPMGAGHTFIVNISVPNIQAAGSQQTQYQTAHAMNKMLAHAVLVG